MNNSFFILDFLSLPLAIAVALPFTPNDDNLTDYNSIWSVLEGVFSVYRTDLFLCYRITQEDYDNRIVKLDFRAK